MRLIALVFTAALFSSAAAAQTAKPSPAPPIRPRPRTRKPLRTANCPSRSERFASRWNARQPRPPAQECAGHSHVPRRNSRASEDRGVAGDAGFQERTGAARRSLCLRAAAVMFPAVDNPLAQPYAAFNQTELLIVGLSLPPVRCSPDTWRRASRKPTARTSCRRTRRRGARHRGILRRQGERRRRYPDLRPAARLARTDTSRSPAIPNSQFLIPNSQFLIFLTVACFII